MKNVIFYRTNLAVIYMVRLVILIGIVVQAISGMASAQVIAADQERTVLLLHSYDPVYSWTKEINDCLLENLNEQYPNVKVNVEFMDTKAISDTEYYIYLAGLYQHKYKSKKFDLIISSDNNALTFLLDNRDNLFQDSPIVFCGINRFSDELLRGQEDITGVVEKIDIGATLDLAINLFPYSNRVVLYGAETSTSDFNRQLFNDVEAKYASRLEFDYRLGMTISETLEDVKTLKATDIIFTLDILRDDEGNVVDQARSVTQISQISTGPVFGLWEFLLGYGIVGGKVAYSKAQGEAAFGLAKRVLDGEDINKVPIIAESPNQVVFDHDQLKRFDIPRQSVPDGSVVINRPLGVVEITRQFIFSIILAFVLLILIITFLLTYNYLRKRHHVQVIEHYHFLQTLLDQIPNPVFFKDTGGRYIGCNTACANLWCKSKEDVIGKTVFDLHTDKLAQTFSEMDHRALATDGVEVLEIRTSFGDDEERDLLIHKSMFNHADGSPGGIIGVAIDISDRKAAEAAVRVSEERFRTIYENAPVMIAGYDRDGNVVLWNSQIEKTLGWMKDDAETVDDVLSLQFPEKEIREQVRKRFGESPGTFREHVVTAKDGSRHNQIWADFRLPDGMIITVGHDITEQRRDEEERQTLQAQFQQAQKLESLGILAGGIAHDFNNLLVGILGNAGLALMELNPTSSSHAHVSSIEASALRAAELTNQLLAYSGKGKFLIRTINLTDLAEEMVNLMQTVVSKKAILNCMFDPGIPLIQGDVTQIRQIIMNLITNASDALCENAGDITVRTGTCQLSADDCCQLIPVNGIAPGNYIYVQVRDSGCGMTREEINKVFDPFYTTKFTGRGLGLAAVMGIVKGHEAALRILSEPNAGTTFTVYFPPYKGETADQAVDPNAVSIISSHEKLRNKLVLVIDDEEIVRSVATKTLKRQGCKVITAVNGREGVDLFKQYCQEIDCVLLDLMMPDMNGEEAFLEMQRIRPDVRVILSSGYNEQDTTNRFAGSGLAGFIQKPYETKALVELLNKTIP